MAKHTVLIVDDEENVSRLLVKVLAKKGYDAHAASNGWEALRILDQQAVDMVITDIRMPDMSGIELLKKIKETDPTVKVVMMTAFATLETAIEALKMGARDYITKPFNLDDVVNAVACLLESSDDAEPASLGILRESKAIENYLICRSGKMKSLMQLVEQVADSHATIMIYGETGTGKELAAQAIHNLSSRRDKPFIKVNCAAIPENLLESELFGYEKGAFTGAAARKPGRFELADGGSIFLDEIGDIPPSIQVKLLRVLQEKEFQHLGGLKTIKVDVRIIAATNRNLEEMVRRKVMREDLYYRLNVVPITMPPLRERREDIKLLIDHFLVRSASISGKPKKHITSEAVQELMNYYWPGNIRELENIIERCVVVTAGDVIDLQDLPGYILESVKLHKEDKTYAPQGEKLDDALDSAEQEAITKALKEYRGNRTKAAEALGISRRSLHRKIAKYNIED